MNECLTTPLDVNYYHKIKKTEVCGLKKHLKLRHSRLGVFFCAFFLVIGFFPEDEK